jgi:hypothetical protein
VTVPSLPTSDQFIAGKLSQAVDEVFDKLSCGRTSPANIKMIAEKVKSTAPTANAAIFQFDPDKLIDYTIGCGGLRAEVHTCAFGGGGAYVIIYYV